MSAEVTLNGILLTGNANEILDRYLRVALRKGLDLLEKDIKANIPVGLTGDARDSVLTDIQGFGANLTGTAYSDLSYMETIEHGKPSGTRVPKTEFPRFLAYVQNQGFGYYDDLAQNAFEYGTWYMTQVNQNHKVNSDKIKEWATGKERDPEKEQSALARAIMFKVGDRGYDGKHPFQRALLKDRFIVEGYVAGAVEQFAAELQTGAVI